MTYQVRDSLNYRDQRWEVLGLPLDPYFDEGIDNPFAGTLDSMLSCPSNCWRGYVATWEVADDALSLVHLSPPGEDELGKLLEELIALQPDAPRAAPPGPIGEIPRATGRGSKAIGLDDLFPGRGGPVEATWFSGILRLSRYRFSGGTPWLEMVFHRGKLLLEEWIDAEGRVTGCRLTGHAGRLFDPRELEILRAEVTHLGQEGLGRRTRPTSRQSIPRGSVDPEDSVWFQRKLIGLPEEAGLDQGLM
jgi:hypothetical protein